MSEVMYSPENNTSSNKTFVNQTKLTIWKPTKDRKGAALQLSFNPLKKAVFFEMMPQTPEGSEKEFAFNNKISARMGLVDLGEILAVLTGKNEGLGKKNEKGYFSGLFHENENGNTIINFAKNQNGNGFFAGLSSKRGDVLNKLSISITYGESEQIRVFIEKYMTEMFV